MLRKWECNVFLWVAETDINMAEKPFLMKGVESIFYMTALYYLLAI